MDLKYAQWSRKNYVAGVTVDVAPGRDPRLAHPQRVRLTARPATATTCDGAQMFSLGYVHNLSKRTAVYTTTALIDNDDGAALALPGGSPGMMPGEKSIGFEAGIRHFF